MWLVLLYWLFIAFLFPSGKDLLWGLLLPLAVHATSRPGFFYLARIYSSDWKYLQYNHFILYFLFIMVEAGFASFHINSGAIVSFSFLRIFTLSMVFLLALTLANRILFYFILNPEGRRKKHGEIPILLYGAGTVAMHLLQDLMDADLTGKYRVSVIVDNDERKIHTRLGPYQIQAGKDIQKLVGQHEIREIWFTMPLAKNFIEAVMDSLKKFSVIYKIVPRKAEHIVPDIRSIRIEDLVKRPEIHLDSSLLTDYFANKRIIITGAAGSIGSEIARQVLQYHPRRVVFVDQWEKGIYDLEKGFSRDEYARQATIGYIADIQNVERMEEIIQGEKPHIIFHAAAYKHVPLMEINYTEAIRTNVLGTHTLFRVISAYARSAQFPVQLVNISSDKAVAPRNIMGITKRISELLAYNMGTRHSENLKTVSVRFGNVLGSSGSVVPLFWEQIQSGGPVTVTHPDMERFFMTIPEAVHLVFHSLLQSTGKDILALDMGEPVKITALAERLIRLAGLVPGKDIDMEYIGRRPGEKLKEELFWTKGSVKTENPYVFRSRRDLKKLEVDDFIRKVTDALAENHSLAWWKKFLIHHTEGGVSGQERTED
jgi:FlaA1/EpsC-like NDP-sugar epimerase